MAVGHLLPACFPGFRSLRGAGEHSVTSRRAEALCVELPAASGRAAVMVSPRRAGGVYAYPPFFG